MTDYFDNVSNGGKYRNEIYNFGNIATTIYAGERVIQGIILKYETFSEIIAATRDGGFGSTSK